MRPLLGACLVLGSGALALHGREHGLQVLAAVGMHAAGLSLTRSSRRRPVSPRRSGTRQERVVGTGFR